MVTMTDNPAPAEFMSMARSDVLEWATKRARRPMKPRVLPI